MEMAATKALKVHMHLIGGSWNHYAQALLGGAIVTGVMAQITLRSKVRRGGMRVTTFTAFGRVAL